MKALCDDLLAEDLALMAFTRRLSPAQWRQPTAFHGWTAWDEVAHLSLLDEAALHAATDAEAFAAHATALRARRAKGEEISAIARSVYADLDGPALLDRWEAIARCLCTALAQRAPQDRLPWFGPSMSARSFATARLMETWAHGQDVFDTLGHERAATARLQHIAHLGVTTFGWSFSNRGRPVPAPVPYVALEDPDGSVWAWNDASQTDFVRGPVLDFCLVVTQRRHVADTRLRHGGSATAWLAIAQCFAGPPADGPAAGTRQRAR